MSSKALKIKNRTMKSFTRIRGVSWESSIFSYCVTNANFIHPRCKRGRV